MSALRSQLFSMVESGLLQTDSILRHFAPRVVDRLEKVANLEQELARSAGSLDAFARGYEFFGMHKTPQGWVFREWAPNATGVYLRGNFSNWAVDPAYRLQPTENGVWEIQLPARIFKHLDPYNLFVTWEGGGSGSRLPSYAPYVCQVEGSEVFNAHIWDPPDPYQFKQPLGLARSEAPYVYEAHIGMAPEDGSVGSFREFQRHMLPRIQDCGYNTIQLMAVAEHPYYGSFGYHVTNYFAPSSRFGTPDDLKALIDAAHERGIAVVMDLVHSHAAKNEVEGLSRFDGSEYQYFHSGPRGHHHGWDSRCFDYGKGEVLHFLLSNCAYWLREFRFDGFRFDGVTSMLYTHHGMGKDFVTYEDYFDPSVDTDALAYLTLANKLIHQINPHAVTIAEDISGMPGLAAPLDKGGFGFDYRLAMGIPDYWIKMIRERRDEDWDPGELFYQVSNRRKGEKTIAYAESHDQALVGDQTIIFRLIGHHMYSEMNVFQSNLAVDRGMALHKMIRLITLAGGGEGYLNFMGNEFGHPEWIDFPRPGNNWSHHYARRQWHLRHDTNLRYRFLAEFDKAMVQVAREHQLLMSPPAFMLHEHKDHQLLAFYRGGLVFVFNFSPREAQHKCPIEVPPGRYVCLLDSDHPRFGGFDQVPQRDAVLTARESDDGQNVYYFLDLVIPSRSVQVYRRLSPSHQSVQIFDD